VEQESFDAVRCLSSRGDELIRAKNSSGSVVIATIRAAAAAAASATSLARDAALTDA